MRTRQYIAIRQGTKKGKRRRISRCEATVRGDFCTWRERFDAWKLAPRIYRVQWNVRALRGTAPSARSRAARAHRLSPRTRAAHGPRRKPCAPQQPAAAAHQPIPPRAARIARRKKHDHQGPAGTLFAHARRANRHARPAAQEPHEQPILAAPSGTHARPRSRSSAAGARRSGGPARAGRPAARRPAVAAAAGTDAGRGRRTAAGRALTERRTIMDIHVQSPDKRAIAQVLGRYFESR